MSEIGARDRLVMAGLVVLGLLTVVAGVVSGRSTINFVLSKDAHDAAYNWAGQIEKTLADQSARTRPRVLDKDIRVLDPAKLNADFPAGAGSGLPNSTSFGDDGPSVVGGISRVTMGWILGRTDKAQDDFVSKLQGFALFAPDRVPLAVAGAVTPSSLQTLFADKKVAAAFANAVDRKSVEILRLPGDADLRAAFVPVIDDGKVERVYAFSIDQAGAAALTNVALTVVTLTTSLLIVMGFSVPAAIASRRIRERWIAEDQIRFLALHDALTGLPNRVQFRQHLERAVARGKRHGRLMAVLCLDLVASSISTTRSAMPAATACSPRLRHASRRMSAKPTWSAVSAATSSRSLPRNWTPQRPPCAWRAASAPRSPPVTR